jgi:hypothetical protein
MPMTEPRIATLLGVWLVLSPWLLGASDNLLLLWTNSAVGAALALSGSWHLIRDRADEPVAPRSRDGGPRQRSQ